MYRKALSVSIFLFSSFFFSSCKGFYDEGMYLVSKGNSAYNQGAFETAIEYYKKAEQYKSAEIIALYNMGNAYYKLENYREAIKNWEKVISTKDKAIKQLAYYNTGLAYYYLKQIDKSINNFRESLKLNPWDKDAQYNFYFLKKLKKESGGKGKNKNEEGNNNMGGSTSFFSLEELLKYFMEKEQENFEREYQRSVPRKWVKDW